MVHAPLGMTGQEPQTNLSRVHPSRIQATSVVLLARRKAHPIMRWFEEGEESTALPESAIAKLLI